MIAVGGVGGHKLLNIESPQCDSGNNGRRRLHTGRRVVIGRPSSVGVNQYQTS